MPPSSSTLPTKESILLESGTNEVEFIEFFLGGISYGINVSKVQRVLAASTVRVSRVAQAPPCVKGIIHIHNKPVMLLDLKEALALCHGQEAQPGSPERQLILVTKFNQITTAFLIDGISKIHRTSWELFEPMSGEFSGPDESAGFATGTVTLQENIIIIIDLERLMLSYFPDSHAHRGRATAFLGERPGRERLSIVYAEDSKMVRNLTRDILQQAGYGRIECFENGMEAYRYLQAKQAELAEHGRSLAEEADLILTDIEMPKMDGLTLCKRIKSELSAGVSPKVVVYSSLINREMAAKCRSVGADAQLAKPEVDQIVALIDQLCLETG